MKLTVIKEKKANMYMMNKIAFGAGFTDACDIHLFFTLTLQMFFLSFIIWNMCCVFKSFSCCFCTKDFEIYSLTGLSEHSFSVRGPGMLCIH